MKMVENYQHQVASHCESGSVRNLLKYRGLDVSEALIFGVGSGVAFAYMSFVKGVGGFPICAIRLPMTAIFKNMQKLCGINFYLNKLKSTDDAMKKANEMIDNNQVVACCVDMFYMKYLPSFMHVHAPFHFIILAGRDEKSYAISDPYSPEIGVLNIQDLKYAWETHALFAKDNLLAYVKNIPDNIDWKTAIKGAINKTCLNMLLQPVVKNILPLFGVNGIKMFAKKMLMWPQKYQGIALREGMLFTPTIFEEQGTGGGAFRFIYGAFLQEAGEIFNTDELGDIAHQMIENGKEWRDASRAMIKLAKKIPMKNDEYSDWYTKNKKEFNQSLSEISQLFICRADEEEKIFKRLKIINKNLK